MRELIALDMPASPDLVDLIKNIWENGDGFAPIDQRLPHAAKQQLLSTMKPTKIIDGSGNTTRLGGGIPLQDSQCLAMATSGTTGNPKIVMYTREQLAASAFATSSFIGTTSSDKWLCCLPVAHIGGLSVILRSIITETSVTVQNGFDSDAVSKAAKEGCSLVSLVPAALQQIDPYIFRKIVLGGSAPPSNIPENTYATYGLTETGSGVVYNGTPLKGLEIKISDEDEILLRGPMIASYYRDDTPITDSNGWFHTRDSGRYTNGKLYVMGRLDDMINTGGEKVFPAPIEAVLASHPKVDQVAVIGVSDKKWGQAVTAVIVAKDRANPPLLDELRNYVKNTLPAYCAPTRLIITESVPVTALGKIQKKLLISHLNLE